MALVILPMFLMARMRCLTAGAHSWCVGNPGC
jgi:hypothetical protein